MILKSLQDFTYIAFKDLLCGNCIVLAIHHIESNSFETFHTSSNHCLLMRKLTLGHLWCTTERLLEIACDYNILPLSFLSLNFWKFQKSNKMAWNFAQMTEAVVVDEKSWFGVAFTHLCGFAVSKISPISLSKTFCVVTLLFWQFTILNRIHLKLSTHHRITVFWWEN